MGLSKNITLTIKDYEIKLDKEIKFYENDTIDLCFSILEYGIEVKDGISINKLMPIQALTSYMLIETPQGVDYAESTKIEDNKIVFKLGSKYSQFVGIGHMQIVIKDSDGCRVTLPEFEFEIKKSINSDWEKEEKELYFLATEDDSIIIDEFGRKIHMSKISDMPISENLSEESYAMIIDEEGNKRFKVRTIADAVEDSLDTKFNAYADEISGDVERIKGEVNEISESLEDMASDIEELKQGDIEIDLTDYAKKSDLEVKVDKVNGKSLILDSEITRLATVKNYDDTEIKNTLNNKANVSDLHSHTNKTVLDGITSAKVNEWNNKSAFDGNYNNLTNKPNIPTKVSQLTNDSGYLTTHQDLSSYAKKSDLPIIVQEIGDSENLIMSQKAVADFVRNTIGDNNNSDYERVDSIDEMIDTSKLYILNSTNTIWVYKESSEGEPIELYEPSKITLNQRYSGSPGAPTVANGFFITDYIPIVNNGNPKIMITDDTGANSTSNTPSIQKCIPIDKNLNSLASLYCYGYNVKQNDHWYATISDKTMTIDLSKRADGSAFEYVDKIKYVRIDVRASSSSITSSESRFITSIKDPNNTVKVSKWVDTGVSEGGYITEAELIKKGYLTSIPSEYVTETELDNINSSLEDVENEIEELKQSGGGSLVPSYVISESESVAEKVLAVRNSDSFVMACASDLHTTGLDTSAIGITHMGMGMNEINKITQLDLVVIFGDIIVNRFDDNYKKGFKHVKKSIDDIRKAVPYIQMQGNHDELSTDTTEQGRQKYYAYIGANNVDVTTDYSNKFRNYGYKDFDNYKMRVIYLNSADVSDGEITTDVNISYEQFNWFINTALDFSKKDDEWCFIVCTHHPLNWVSECMPKLLNILDSYKGNTSGSISVGGQSINYNFTTTKATLIAHFHGHLHNFRSETLGTNKVLSITIPNACFGRNNEYGTSSSYSEELHIRYGDIDENGVQRQFNKTSNTANDTAFNIVVIDCLNSMIHCFNYGAGIDRTINFDGTTGVNPEPPSGYTNVIETVGYTNNVRISTSTGETKPDDATGYTTTGFIEVKEGDIIRTSGIDMKKSAEKLYCSYAIFDSNKTKTGTGYLDPVSTTALTTSFDSNGNLTLTCGVGFNAVKSYLRLCGFGDGANLIVTVNQEIT